MGKERGGFDGWWFACFQFHNGVRPGEEERRHVEWCRANLDARFRMVPRMGTERQHQNMSIGVSECQNKS